MDLSRALSTRRTNVQRVFKKLFVCLGSRVRMLEFSGTTKAELTLLIEECAPHHQNAKQCDYTAQQAFDTTRSLAKQFLIRKQNLNCSVLG